MNNLNETISGIIEWSIIDNPIILELDSSKNLFFLEKSHYLDFYRSFDNIILETGRYRAGEIKVISSKSLDFIEIDILSEGENLEDNLIKTLNESYSGINQNNIKESGSFSAGRFIRNLGGRLEISNVDNENSYSLANKIYIPKNILFSMNN